MDSNNDNYTCKQVWAKVGKWCNHAEAVAYLPSTPIRGTRLGLNGKDVRACPWVHQLVLENACWSYLTIQLWGLELAGEFSGESFDQTRGTTSCIQSMALWSYFASASKYCSWGVFTEADLIMCSIVTTIFCLLTLPWPIFRWIKWKSQAYHVKSIEYGTCHKRLGALCIDVFKVGP